MEMLNPYIMSLSPNDVVKILNNCSTFYEEEEILMQSFSEIRQLEESIKKRKKSTKTKEEM